jgi:hypothetical protein
MLKVVGAGFVSPPGVSATPGGAGRSGMCAPSCRPTTVGRSGSIRLESFPIGPKGSEVDTVRFGHTSTVCPRPHHLNLLSGRRTSRASSRPGWEPDVPLRPPHLGWEFLAKD